MHLLTLLSSAFTRSARPERTPASAARSRQTPALESDAEAERLKDQILSSRRVTKADRQRSAAVARRILWGVWADKLASGEFSGSFDAFVREGR